MPKRTGHSLRNRSACTQDDSHRLRACRSIAERECPRSAIDGILSRDIDVIELTRTHDDPIRKACLAILLCLAAGSAIWPGRSPCERRASSSSADALSRSPTASRSSASPGPPLVDRPIVADFDEQGRLYVADSSGSNDKVQKQLAEEAAPHRPARGHRRRRQVRQAAPSSPTR